MIKRSGVRLSLVFMVMTLWVAAPKSLAQDYYFGNFEEDVQFNGQYVLEQGAEGYAGWYDWAENPDAGPEIPSASPSTSTGVTTGVNSIAWQPNITGYHQGLAVQIQHLPEPTRNAFFDAFFNNTHIAMNVTWDNDEWFLQYNGDGWNGAQVGLAINYGPGGTYQDQSFPDVDTGNEGNRGHWDLTNYPGVHNRIVMWDYSAHKAAIQALYNSGAMNETNGWLQFMLWTNKGNFNLPVTFYIDSWRLTSLGAEGLQGDYNGDQVVDAADYTVWRDNLGATDESSINDNGDGLNGVDPADYTLWKNQFGTGGGAVGAAAVPEPAAWLLGAIVFGALAVVRRRTT